MHLVSSDSGHVTHGTFRWLHSEVKRSDQLYWWWGQQGPKFSTLDGTTALWCITRDSLCEDGVNESALEVYLERSSLVTLSKFGLNRCILLSSLIFTPAKNTTEAAQILTTAMAQVQGWLTDSWLSLNVKKCVCMIFAKRPPNIVHSGVFLGGDELALLSEFRYLGVILDSTLSFRKHIKKV